MTMNPILSLSDLLRTTEQDRRLALMRVTASLVPCLLWAAAATAQTPLGAEFVPATFDVDFGEQLGANVACNNASVCALVWTSAGSGHTSSYRQWARTVSPLGTLSPLQLLRADEGLGFTTQILPLNPGFILFNQGPQTGSFGFWTYGENLRPLRGFVRQPFHGPARFGDADSINHPGAVAAIPGGFAQIGSGFDQPESPCEDGSCFGVFLYFFDLDGHKLRERTRVKEDLSSGITAWPNSLAVDGNGNLIVAFNRIHGVWPNDSSKAFVRRFSPTGEPLSPETAVEVDLPDDQHFAAVAASPNGEFLVVWANATGPFRAGEIYARRFGAGGEPLGPSFRVSDEISGQSHPRVAADREGNYFIAWNYENPFHIFYEVWGRLYRHDGRPVTTGFQIHPDAAGDRLVTTAAFAPNGTLTVSYVNWDYSLPHGQRRMPVIRRYAASPGQEICGILGSEVRCDLARTGGAAELEVTWGGRPGEETLFGDVDGDGRDDVCSYFKGKFRCDISHEGVNAGWSETFGSPGDVPLLADVDGDGRADPCVRRGHQLLCDTVQDGKVHYQVTFGRRGEVPFLGDLDGDHKADLCLVNGSAWDCLLTTGQQLRFQLGRRGDSPALGDADRDGRADPCVLRPGGRLQCSTQHDGGPPDYNLTLNVPSGARPLFGNLDGL